MKFICRILDIPIRILICIIHTASIVVVNIGTFFASEMEATIQNNQNDKEENTKNRNNQTDVDGFGRVNNTNIVCFACLTANMEGNECAKCLGNF
ncbi:MAG: hypothetical protein J6V22_05375, partial [Clostridia bacterium]|nr:hypothetical protein [Clostridia bacterium]